MKVIGIALQYGSSDMSFESSLELWSPWNLPVSRVSCATASLFHRLQRKETTLVNAFPKHMLSRETNWVCKNVAALATALQRCGLQRKYTALANVFPKHLLATKRNTVTWRDLKALAHNGNVTLWHEGIWKVNRIPGDAPSASDNYRDLDFIHSSSFTIFYSSVIVLYIHWYTSW